MRFKKSESLADQQGVLAPPDDINVYEALERARTRARQFRDGFLKGLATADRQLWMEDAALLLELLARKLREKLPPESYSDFIKRHAELGHPASQKQTDRAP